MPCSVCQGKGLIPWKRKDGSVIPHAFQNCECKLKIPEHYQPTTPADFDFPCSDTFRGFTFENCDRDDPRPRQPITEPPLPQPKEVIRVTHVYEHHEAERMRQDAAKKVRASRKGKPEGLEI